MRSGRQGFTVIELLVAATITVVLAGVLIAVTGGALNIWRRAQGGLTANAQAKLVFDLIERDLQAAVYRENGESLLAADITDNTAALTAHGWRTTATMMKPAGGESLQLLGDPNNPAGEKMADARFGLSGVWLRFVATNVSSGGSLPVVVSYQMARRAMSGSTTAPSSVPPRYILFRDFSSTRDPVENGYNVDGSTYDSSLIRPGSQNALCSNVVDFGVWFYRWNSTGGAPIRIFPSSATDLNHRGNGVAGAGNDTRFPDVIDVMVRIMTEEGAAQLENMENGRINRPAQYATDAEWWWAVVEANSKVFVDRIVLGGRRS